MQRIFNVRKVTLRKNLIFYLYHNKVYMNVWKQALKKNDVSKVKEMIENKNKLCNFWLAKDWCRSDEMRELIMQNCKRIGMLTPFGLSYNMEPVVCGKEKKYAVVEWFNYRKEHHAGCRAIFEKYEDAKDYAYKCVVVQIFNDLYENYKQVDNETFIKLQEIINKQKYTLELTKEEQRLVHDCYDSGEGMNCYVTDSNDSCSPYDNPLVSYTNSDDGYECSVFCVVKYFPGVENRWNLEEGRVIIEPESQWCPEYE